MSKLKTGGVLGLELDGTNLMLKPLKEDTEKGKGNGEGDDSDEDDTDDEESDGSGDSDGDDEEDSDSEGGSKSDSEDGEEDGDDSDGSSGDGEEDGDEDGSSSSGDDSGDENGDSDGADGDGSDADADGSEGEQKEHPGEHRGGSGAGDADQAQIEFAQALLDAMAAGEEPNLLDNNSALKGAYGEEIDETTTYSDHEAPWRPYDPSLDVVEYVPEGDRSTAQRMRDSVKREISSLAAKMRTKFLEARRQDTIHGVRKGRGLSDRTLVSTFTEIKSQHRPTRPEWDRIVKEEVTLASAVVIDQSGSMSSLREQAARASIAIAEPLDRLGCPSLVVGPRGNYNSSHDPDMTREQHADDMGYGYGAGTRFHRNGGVTVDVFKDWDEKFDQILARFTNVKATGGTPLCDGIQYAMQELSHRPERFRVIFVVTDGYPNQPNVVRRQIRLAAEAGVFIVGVGLQGGKDAVKDLFPVHVAVEKLHQLPQNMLQVLTSIMFPKRGKRIALDGKFGGGRSRR